MKNHLCWKLGMLAAKHSQELMKRFFQLTMSFLVKLTAGEFIQTM